jgi:hypothetical protein
MKLATLFIGTWLACAPIVAFAAGDARCTKDVLLPFFPKVFLNDALKKYQVPSDEWVGIANDLAAKDKGVILLVEAKANKMNPNPLKDPSKRAEAVKLFDETLQTVFTDVMHAHGVLDDNKVKAIFNEVKQERMKRFTECFSDNGPEEKEDAGEK